MLFAVICQDKPDSQELRQANRPAHIEFLDGLGDALKLAGPFVSEDGDAMTGSLLIVEADSLADARDLVDDDPYALAGLFARTDIRPWKQVVNRLEA